MHILFIPGARCLKTGALFISHIFRTTKFCPTSWCQSAGRQSSAPGPPSLQETTPCLPSRPICSVVQGSARKQNWRRSKCDRIRQGKILLTANKYYFTNTFIFVGDLIFVWKKGEEKYIIVNMGAVFRKEGGCGGVWYIDSLHCQGTLLYHTTRCAQMKSLI